MSHLKKPSERAAESKAAPPLAPLPKRPSQRKAEETERLLERRVKTTLHVPHSLHRRLRIYTALTGTPMNTFLLQQAESALARWEQKNGAQVASVAALDDRGDESEPS